MPNAFGFTQILKLSLLATLLLGVVLFVSFQNAYGAFLATVTLAIAAGVYKNKGLAYFAAAAWGLACYQLAKEGYEFKDYKHETMTLGFFVIPVALFLHEKFVKKMPKNEQNSKQSDSNQRNMPD